MRVAITFDYICSEWTIIYEEDRKVQIVAQGRTLQRAFDKLDTQRPFLANQIKLWFNMAS